MNNKLSKKEIEAFRLIRNAIVHEQRPPSLRKIAEILGYRSPRSATIITKKLTKEGFIKRKNDGGWQVLKDFDQGLSVAQTIKVPLVGCVACGSPILAEENIEAYIPVSIQIAKPGNKYYLLRAKGDSMNKKGINDGDLVLVKFQQTAENGDLVVALIDDSATVKEFNKTNNAIILKPYSTNKKHQPIILHNNFVVQGIIQSIIKA